MADVFLNLKYPYASPPTGDFTEAINPEETVRLENIAGGDQWRPRASEDWKITLIGASTSSMKLGKTLDQAQTWNNHNAAVSNLNTRLVAISRSGQYMLAGTDDTSYSGSVLTYSDDYGSTWKTYPTHPFSGYKVRYIQGGIADDGTVAVGFYWAAGFAEGGDEKVYVRYSTDGGNTWLQPTTDTPEDVYSVTSPPASLSSIFISRDGQVIFFCRVRHATTATWGTRITRDGGATWQVTYPGGTGATEFNSASGNDDGSILYMGGSYATHDNYLYRSVDYGYNWAPLTRLLNGDPVQIGYLDSSDSGNEVVALTTHPTDGNATWVSVNAGLTFRKLHNRVSLYFNYDLSKINQVSMSSNSTMALFGSSSTTRLAYRQAVHIFGFQTWAQLDVEVVNLISTDTIIQFNTSTTTFTVEGSTNLTKTVNLVFGISVSNMTVDVPFNANTTIVFGNTGTNFSITAGGATGRLKIWNGSSWEWNPTKQNTIGSWNTKAVKFWNGNSWSS